MKSLSLPAALPGCILLFAILSSCSTGARDGASTSRDRISLEELQEVSASSAYQAVQRLRPQWLRGRGANSAAYGASLPSVFVDEVPFGPIESLRNIQVVDVRSMQFINARDATTRFGTGYTAGIIEIVTRSGRAPR